MHEKSGVFYVSLRLGGLKVFGLTALIENLNLAVNFSDELKTFKKITFE
jgi:hypothetical protein